MQDEDIARWRLQTQRLVAPFHDSACDVVEALLAVQAENVATTAWAVAARTIRPDAADLDALLDAGTVIRTHVLRPTWHYVLADDLGWLLDLTGARVQRVTGQQLRVTHGLDDAEIEVAQQTVAEILADRGELVRAELAAELEARDVTQRSGTTSMFVMLLLAHTELSGLICSGRPKSGEHTYALLSERVPNTRRLDRDEALGELALRYFTGHGPATERDLAYWATLTLGDVRRGLDLARDGLDSFEHDGNTYWRGAGETLRKTPPQAHLLQILDELYRGYQHSRWVLDAAGLANRGREPTLGMALVDGQFVARVRRTAAKGATQFALEPLRPLDAAELDELEQAAQRYGTFAGSAVGLTSSRSTW